MRLAQLSLAKRQFDDAIASLRQAASLSPGATEILGLLGYAYGVAGRRSEAQNVLADLSELSKRQYVAAFDVAMVRLGLGQKEPFFAALETAAEERDTLVAYLNVDTALEPVQSDPRLQRLAERLGLPPPASLPRSP